MRADEMPTVYIRSRAGKPLAIPLSACVPSKQSQLDELLMRAGFVDVVPQLPTRALAAALRQFAATTKVRVLDRDGFHTVELAGGSHRVLVKGGECHWLDAAPNDGTLVLVGKAAQSTRSSGSHKKFRKAFKELLPAQPRLLVGLLFALAAGLAPEFGILLVALLLVGPSSIGKSIIQRACSLLVSGADSVRQLDATPQGLIEFLQAQGAAAVYLEDTHSARMWEALCEAIMATGNGAEGRLRSSHSRHVANDAPTRATLVMSAEAGLAETVRLGHGTLRAGLYARLLEVHPGEHGMFDDLCGHTDSASLALHIEEQAKQCAGVVGQAFFTVIASNWAEVRELWVKKHDFVQAAILRHAGLGEIDGVTHRLLEALTFVGFVGAVAAKHDVLPVKLAHVFRSLGLLLGEQVKRLKGMRTPVGLAAVDAVRLFIQTNRGKFLPIEQASDPTHVNGLVGYVKHTKRDTLFLFYPGVFHERFVGKFGDEVYGHLRSAAVLRTHESRGNRYQARLQLPGRTGSDRPQDFVAISESILFAED